MFAMRGGAVRFRLTLTAIGLLIPAAGCGGPSNWRLDARSGGSAALFGQFQAFDGRRGRPISFGDMAAICASADVVLFGEEHNNVVCNQIEAQLLAAIAERGPTALAMEFFEADTQASLSAYLSGRIEEDAFREQARQKSSYLLSHRPLIELSRAARIPVIAANIPRRLVRAFSASGKEFSDFRAETTAEDRRWLPRSYVYVEGPYRDRFMEMMSAHPAPTSQPASRPASQPATTTAATTAPESEPAQQRSERFYRSQLLWDNAMADAVASFRESFGNRRVMLVVGSFHVARDGGTWRRLRDQRPKDRISTVVFRARESDLDVFDDEDRGLGDFVVYGITPPPKPPAGPTTRPAATQPATTQSAVSKPADS
jgi:uncharacterized iron-regulated protein